MPPTAPCHRQDQSTTIGRLAFALAKAQGCMQAAGKGAENPFFKSRYADLSEVWATIRKPLADNELAVMQTTVAEEGKLRLRTVLVHSSGEWVESVYPVNPQKQDPQGRLCCDLCPQVCTQCSGGSGCGRGRRRGRGNGPACQSQQPSGKEILRAER